MIVFGWCSAGGNEATDEQLLIGDDRLSRVWPQLFCSESENVDRQDDIKR